MNQKPVKSVVNLSIDGIPQHDLDVGDEIHVINEVGTIYIDGTQLPTRKAQPEFENSKKPRRSGIYCCLLYTSRCV